MSVFRVKNSEKNYFGGYLQFSEKTMSDAIYGQRASAHRLLEFINYSLLVEVINETDRAQNYENLRLQEILNFLQGLVSRCTSTELKSVIRTGGVAYSQYRNLFPFGGEGIRAIKFSGKQF